MAVAVNEPILFTASRPQRFYRPELDALRSFAFIAVFFAHTCVVLRTERGIMAALAESGSFGVDLFFVLSAYLLTELLLREKASFGAVNVKAFYIRRGLRIWPLYFAFLAAVFALTRFSFGPKIPAIFLAMFAVFAGNFACYLSQAIDLALSPLWSVSLEEQFYALLPWVIRFASRRALVLLAAGIWLISIACRAWIFHNNTHNPSRIWYFPLARLDAIGCGILISATRIGEASLRGKSRAELFIAGIALLIAAGAMLPSRHGSGFAAVVMSYALAAIGCGAVLRAAIGCSNRIMHNSLLIYFGKISYGLYVFHGGMLLIARSLTDGLPRGIQLIFCPLFGLMATAAIAAASYRCLESPFLRLKRRFEYVRH